MPVIDSAEGMERFRVPGYETDGLTDILVGWLGEQTREPAGQPFFAVLSVRPPHNPYADDPRGTARRTTPT